MWQIICLCLPAMMPGERKRFLALFRDVLHAQGRELDTADLSLWFLQTLSPPEALTVLEERLYLVARSLELLGPQPAMESAPDLSEWLMDDHLRTLLAAEHEWLTRTIAHLQRAQPSQQAPGKAYAASGL